MTNNVWEITLPDGQITQAENLRAWCNDHGHDYFSVWGNQNGYMINRAPDDHAKARVEGYIHITNAETGEILASKHNAIHYENFAEAISLALMDFPEGHIHEMVFGNGASTVSGTGGITYLSPNVSGTDAQLYNQTFRKIVDDRSSLMLPGMSGKNNIVKKHVSGNVYTDIIVTCTLDYNEPSGQEAFDDSTDLDGTYVFDELGLKAFNVVASTGALLTHVIFHPIQKSLNRVIEIVYTLRIYMN